MRSVRDRIEHKDDAAVWKAKRMMQQVKLTEGLKIHDSDPSPENNYIKDIKVK